MLSDIVGKVEPGKAVIEGIHAEGPCVQDCGGLPETDHQTTPPAKFEILVNTWNIFHLNLPTLSRVTKKIYQSWYMYLSRVAINRFHLKLFLTSTL